MDLQLLPKETADALDLHRRRIALAIVGHRKGALEQFGYAFLAGREMLQVKALLPNGNTSDRSLGFMRWVSEHFPQIHYRTATRWMIFAESIIVVLEARRANPSIPPAKRRLLVGNSKGRVTKRDHATISEVIPVVMDNKSMLAFMRDTEFLRDPEKPKHHPRQKVDAEKARAAKIKQAVRHWENIVNAQALGDRLLKLLDKPQLQQILERNLSTNELLRTLIKAETNGGNHHAKGN